MRGHLRIDPSQNCGDLPGTAAVWLLFDSRRRREESLQAKNLAQQSLNAGLRATRDSTALMLEEVARMNAAAVRKAFEEGVTRMGQKRLRQAAGSLG